MNSHEPVQVDQALFGYSDGHRQIAASIGLPPKDRYHLAAASDLAPGAHLNANDSYLTGLPLAESRRFALIRTWPAPEMPRPGCVWSHVILIDSQLLASHSDLSVFLDMLRRPDANDQSAYGEPLTLPSSGRRSADPDRRALFDLLTKYYSGKQVFLHPDAVPQALDAAIFAVWSQQWPRLRMSFTFRTAPGAARRRSELIDYDVHVGTGGRTTATDDGSELTWPLWVLAAAEDAARSSVTPLRRFLWRYGRDLSAPRAHFRTLVELYLAIQDTDVLSEEDAVRIFQFLPQPGDGEILKRDILGIGPSSTSLIPALGPADLIQLLASNRMQAPPDEGHIRKRFETVPPEDVAKLAQLVILHRNALEFLGGCNQLRACIIRYSRLADQRPPRKYP